jgi:hypothetical protein
VWFLFSGLLANFEIPDTSKDRAKSKAGGLEKEHARVEEESSQAERDEKELECNASEFECKRSVFFFRSSLFCKLIIS